MYIYVFRESHDDIEYLKTELHIHKHIFIYVYIYI
jgi:hypothetical protein